MNTNLDPLLEIMRIANAAIQVASTQGYRADTQQNIPAGYPEILEMIVLAVARRLEKNGLARAASLDIAFQAAEEVRFQIGGTKIYIPKGDHIESDELALSIVNEFKGNNIADLARQHNITEQWIYQILKRNREAQTKSKQSNLF